MTAGGYESFEARLARERATGNNKYRRADIRAVTLDYGRRAARVLVASNVQTVIEKYSSGSHPDPSVAYEIANNIQAITGLHANNF